MNKSLIKLEEELGTIFENGKGLRGVVLKRYTGAELEKFSRLAINAVLEELDMTTDMPINQDYVEDENGEFDGIRLDDHVWINGKLVMMQEARAWVDKPFCTMKYNVVQDVFLSPHANSKIIEDIIFPIVCLSYNVTQLTFNTRDYIISKALTTVNKTLYNSQGTKRIKLFNLSGYPRQADKFNYFDRGYSKDNLKEYVEYLYNYFKAYKNDEIN